MEKHNSAPQVTGSEESEGGDVRPEVNAASEDTERSAPSERKFVVTSAGILSAEEARGWDPK